jgi:hypothetical protein
MVISLDVGQWLWYDFLSAERFQKGFDQFEGDWNRNQIVVKKSLVC